MRIYLIRHTETVLQKGICYGQSDVSLAPDFELQAEAVIAKLPSEYSQIYASPLKRCQQLAELLSEKLSKRRDGVIEPTKDSRLKELNFGEWELQDWDNIYNSDRDFFNRWSKDYTSLCPPQGETYNALLKRVGEFWEEKIFECTSMNSEDNAVLLVTHAGVIRAILSKLLDIPIQQSFLVDLDYGSVTKIGMLNGLYKVNWINR
jgi:alpha-ribazole phosphatase